MSAVELQTWIDTAAAEVVGAANRDGGWAYAPGCVSNCEATAICALALSAVSKAPEAVLAAAGWLASRRRSEGGFGLSADSPDTTWATPFAAQVLARAGGAADAVTGAVDYLLNTTVFSISPTPSVYGYDTSLRGWAWTVGDYSFIEPTAQAVVFLKQQGSAAHERVQEALRLIRDRVLSGGGWNYGEPVILDSELWPAETPTAMALLALADEQDAVTAAALDWLVSRQGKVTSLFSLGWAATALNLYGALDESWKADLVQVWTDTAAERRTAMDTSLCLLGVAAADGHPFTLSD